MKYIIVPDGVQIGSSYTRNGEELLIPVQVVVGIEGALQTKWGKAEYICNIEYPATIKQTPEDIEAAIPAFVGQWVADNFPNS